MIDSTLNQMQKLGIRGKDYPANFRASNAIKMTGVSTKFGPNIAIAKHDCRHQGVQNRKIRLETKDNQEP